MNTKLKLLAAAVAIATITSPAMATNAAERVAQLEAEYKAKMTALQKEATHIADDKPSQFGTVIGVDCKIESNLKSLKFDLPKIEMRRQVWKYDLPEMFWGITDVGPIKLHLPQFRMRRQETTLDVPEFFMERQEIKMHLPEFFCTDAQVQLGKIAFRGNEIAVRGQAMGQQMERDLKLAQADVVREQREASLKQVDDAIAGLQAFVSTVEGRKGNAGEMRAKLQELRAQRERMVARFEQALRYLS